MNRLAVPHVVQRKPSLGPATQKPITDRLTSLGQPCVALHSTSCHFSLWSWDIFGGHRISSDLEARDYPAFMSKASSESRLMEGIAVVATAFFVLAANGQVVSAGAADEPAGPPSPYARTAFAYGIGKTEAVLIGFVNARGSSTTAQFQVGRTKSYGRWIPAGPPEEFYAGRHSSEVEQGVDRLRPGTNYHFRLVATNAGGKTYGQDRTFTTLPR